MPIFDGAIIFDGLLGGSIFDDSIVLATKGNIIIAYLRSTEPVEGHIPSIEPIDAETPSNEPVEVFS